MQESLLGPFGNDIMLFFHRVLWSAMDNGTKERVVQEVCLLISVQLHYITGKHCLWGFSLVVTFSPPVHVVTRQQKWGLNTYLYAPKDDYKHRMFWRELYSVEEAGWFKKQFCCAIIHYMLRSQVYCYIIPVIYCFICSSFRATHDSYRCC